MITMYIETTGYRYTLDECEFEVYINGEDIIIRLTDDDINEENEVDIMRLFIAINESIQTAYEVNNEK